MRIVKDAQERKNEILDAAEVLFSQKGFDGTSTSDILDQVGIARGTLYHHFKSKEDIMDALLERYNTKILAAAKRIAENQSIPVVDRLIQTIMALNINSQEGSKVIEHIHKPQNALMHQKMQKIILEGVPPILTEIIQDGIEEGLMNTPFPYESIEMLIAYINAVLDHDLLTLTEEARRCRIKAFIFNAERLFGTACGSLAQMMQVFPHESNQTAP